MDFNTIILWYGMYDLVKEEDSYEEVQKGDSIWGCDALPIEIKRWKITEMEEAKKELAENMCHYRGYYDYDHYRHHYPDGYHAREYALVYCVCDAYGEIQDIAYFELAEDAAVVRANEIVKLLQENPQKKAMLLYELCSLADLWPEWDDACEYEADLASGDAEEGDSESCEEVALWAAERLGVEIRF